MNLSENHCPKCGKNLGYLYEEGENCSQCNEIRVLEHKITALQSTVAALQEDKRYNHECINSLAKATNTLSETSVKTVGTAITTLRELQKDKRTFQALLIDAKNVMQLSSNLQDAYRENRAAMSVDLAIGLKRVVSEIDAALATHSEGKEKV